MSLLQSVVVRIEDVVYGAINILPVPHGEEDDGPDDPLIKDELPLISNS
jgi:hypothetical protein